MTNFARIFYYIAIVFLVITGCGIVWRLIIFPPCSQIGNTCVVDPGTVAGLAAMVLGVAATVLAIFGALAVAVWWTWLDNRVTEQVNKLYEKQTTAVDERVRQHLSEMKNLVDDELKVLATEITAVRTAFEQARELSQQMTSFATESNGKLEDLKAHVEETERAAQDVRDWLLSILQRAKKVYESDDGETINIEVAPNANNSNNEKS